MDEQIAKEYEDLLDLFTHPGWKLLQEDFKRLLKLAKENADVECPSNDLWQFRRGEINKLNQITGYEELIKAAFEQLKEDEQDVDSL